MKLYENTQKIKRPFSLVMVHIAIPFFFALWALISIPIFKDPRIGEYEKAEILGEGLPFIFLVVYVKYIVSLVPSCFLRLLLRKPLRKKWALGCAVPLSMLGWYCYRYFWFLFAGVAPEPGLELMVLMGVYLILFQ